MPDTHVSVELIRPDILATVARDDISVERLCHLLIECEKTQHRYQWTSGVLLVTLMSRPESPKKLSQFVIWLGEQTGMHLTQNEIKRRIDVYQFYSKFDDNTGIIELIQQGGVQIAHRARRVLDHAKPDHAREVLKACLQSPGKVEETLQHFGVTITRKPSRSTVRVSMSALNDIRLKLSTHTKRIGETDYVELPLVLDLLSKLQGNEG